MEIAGAAVLLSIILSVWVGSIPEAVMISVRGGKEGEALAGVHRAERHRVQDVDLVGVLRIGEDVREVPARCRNARRR